MKRVIALCLAVLMTLTGCTQQTAQNPTLDTSTPSEVETSSAPTSETEQTTAQDVPVFAEDTEPNFATLSDPSLLQYVEDNIYSDLVARFDSEDYIVESVNAVYVSDIGAFGDNRALFIECRNTCGMAAAAHFNL